MPESSFLNWFERNPLGRSKAISHHWRECCHAESPRRRRCSLHASHFKKCPHPAGYTVEEASNGAEAVAKYSEVNPDVVTMDITMPEKDGIQATREIMKLDPNARVVMVSALGQEKMVKEAILSGAKDFIVKPFKPDRILSALDRVLS
ncbi:MAG: Chemotaxis protein CheY [Candidatus Hinthialibacteria bacterium OLB16]|nr:MAG: Chemotaxis protein CheY [Candidatus Hinthialibacteria bacterium OLB16]